jgi:hypothetical protein
MHMVRKKYDSRLRKGTIQMAGTLNKPEEMDPNITQMLGVLRLPKNFKYKKYIDHCLFKKYKLLDR